MNAVERAINIITKPAAEWQVIDNENQEPKPIYFNYLLFLLAIPAVATFIGSSIIGIPIPFMGYIRVPIIDGLVQMVLGFVLSAGAIYVAALVINMLAPTFSAQQNQNKAFELVAYASTIVLVSSIAMIYTPLIPLLLIASFYGLYTFYIGLPVMMKCPKEKALPYTAVMMAVMFVVGIFFAIISNLFMPSMGPRMSGASMPAITIDGPNGGKVSIDLAKMEAAGKEMEAASKRMEAAQKSGDAQAAAKASQEQMNAAVSTVLGSVAGISAGGAAGAPARKRLSDEQLKSFSPEALGGFKREGFETSVSDAAGFGMSNSKARYRKDAKTVEFEITDAGGLAGLASMAGWLNVTSSKETESGTERVYKSGNRTVKEIAAKDNQSASLTFILANGILVDISARGMGIAELKELVVSMGLTRIETA